MEPRSFAQSEPARVPPDESRAETRADSPVARVVAGWLQQLSRTIKTCRLYDAANPTVVTFRRDLAAALEVVLNEFGAIQLRFTPQEIVLGETPLYAARAREDNLALPFFRDGIRTLSLQPGIAQREVDALVNAFLTVTQRSQEDSDLVTLLWEYELDHVGVEYVSTEGDVETGGAAGGDTAEATAAAIAPWPKTAGPGAAGETRPSAGAERPTLDDTGRSDDRITAGRARELEATLLKLEIGADAELERFLREHDEERRVPMSRGALDLMTGCFTHAGHDGDRAELRHFIPRLLHEAVSSGEWSEARECFYLLRDPTHARDGAGEFVRDIARPDSVTSRNAWKCLDAQTPEQHTTFFEFARELGPDAADWLMRGIAESQRQALRREMARVLAGIVADNPERLAPWLADERWYVVRNVVYILGLMESAVPVGLLKSASSHPEFRVRREVVATLGRAPGALARPLLLEMLNSPDARLLGSILHNLSSAPDPELAALLLARIEDTGFASRPEDEKRSVYQALAAVGGDEVLPPLEAEVLQGSWFAHGNDASRMAAAMCLARIGTPAARGILERGAKSRRAEVARACNTGLATLRPGT